jgi:hypothetical protein
MPSHTASATDAAPVGHVESLDDIALGMTHADVRWLKGEPVQKGDEWIYHTGKRRDGTISIALPSRRPLHRMPCRSSTPRLASLRVTGIEGVRSFPTMMIAQKGAELLLGKKK